MSQQPQAPVKVFPAGRGIEVAVWENTVEKNGRTVTSHSVRISKQYRDKDGNWQDSDYLFMEELPGVRDAMARAMEWSQAAANKE